VGYARRLQMIASLALLGAAAPAASAEYFAYQGELRFTSSSLPTCTPLTTGTFHVVIVGRNGGPFGGGIEAYLMGEQLLHGYIRGMNPAFTSIAYVGESAPSHPMGLRMTGLTSYAGQLQAKSLLGAMLLCPFDNAQISISKVAGVNEAAAFQSAANQFQLDNRALQTYLQGMQGNARSAIAPIEQALALKRQSLDPSSPQLLPYYYSLAQLHYAEGSIPASIPVLRSGAAICEKVYGPQSACAGALLATLGAALADGGVYAEAETTLRRALTICDKYFGPGSPMRGPALNGLSIVLMYTGRYSEAERALTEALAVNKRWPNPSNINVAASLTGFGILYQLTGQYKKAVASLRQAVAMNEKTVGADNPATINSEVILARALRVSGDNQAAESTARHALAAAERVLGRERQDHPALGGARVVLADILRETGRNAEAEPLYRKALADATKYLGPDHPQVAGVSLLLAKLLHETGRDQEALGLLSHANVVAHLSGSEIIAWQAAGELMEVYSSGKYADSFKAIFYGKEAVNDLQRLRGNLSGSSAETQQAFVSSAEVSAIYRRLADLLIGDGRPAEAQQVLAMVKEQEFYEFTQRTASSDAPKTVATLNAGEKQLDDLNGKYVSLGKEYGTLQEKYRQEGDRFGAADHARLDELRKAMDAAQANFEARSSEIAKSANDPEAQKRRRTEINDYSRAFQGTLKDMGHDAVVAQYIVLNDKVAILLASPNVVIARESKIKRQDLYARIRDFRRALSNPNQDPLPSSQALYQILVAPIAGDLRQAGAKTLMVDLDDMLRYVPFAALYDGKNYLVENTSVVMVTEAVRDKLGKAPRSDWSVWGLGTTKPGPGYEALPYAAVELNGIAGQKGILGGKVMLDGAFTERSLRDGLDQSYPIIHIASHFQFSPGSMDDSFLLMGDGTRLTLAQIKTKLNFSSVELLTLSACETAVGDDSTSHHGVEVEGLGAIAQQAGAKAVLATLWPVADASTAALMRALYQAHKVDRLDKADALRQAQLALLHGSAKIDGSDNASRGLTRVGASQSGGSFKVDPGAPFAHPFYWAPFILMGNWL
jgi:CHAT domain-containing protein